MFPGFILAIEDDGNREFMLWLYLKYSPLLYAEIKQVVKNPWDADDALQIAIERLIDKVAFLRTLSQKGLAAYLIVTARHTAYNLFREKKRTLFLKNEQDVASGGPPVEDRVIMNDCLRRLSEIWDSLDDKTQYLLYAKYILNKSAKEIAQDLNMPPGNVRMALVRARRKACQAMQGWQPPS